MIDKKLQAYLDWMDDSRCDKVIDINKEIENQKNYKPLIHCIME